MRRPLLSIINNYYAIAGIKDVYRYAQMNGTMNADQSVIICLSFKSIKSGSRSRALRVRGHLPTSESDSCPPQGGHLPTKNYRYEIKFYAEYVAS